MSHALSAKAELEMAESERLLENEEKDTTDDSSSDNSIVIDVNDGDELFFEPEFEKEFMKFKVSSINNKFLLTEESQKLNQSINENLNNLASQILFSWKKVPIIFPKSITGLADGKSDSENNSDLNLFNVPANDDLDEISCDSNGAKKRLNKDQQESIKRHGNFEVESKNYPGMNHKWQLAKWLQKGYENSNQSFFKDVSRALGLIIITAKNKFTSKNFSVLNGLKSWKTNFVNLIDILIGIPHMNTVPYLQQLKEERQKFLVSGLVVDECEQEKFAKLCAYISSNIKEDENKILKQNFQMPCFYKTANNLSIDLRLFDEELMEQINPVLTKLLEPTSVENEHYNKISIELITLYKDLNLTEQEIIEKTSNALMNEYIANLYKKISSDERLEKISPGISKLLIDHCKSFIIIKQTCKELNENMRKHMSDYESNLRKNYRVKSLVRKWIDECKREEKEKFLNENKYKIHLISIEKCIKENLNQTAYFLERELLFIKEHEKPAIERFEKIKRPARSFVFYRDIWFPKNYKIKYDKNRYYLEKSVQYKTSTQYPFWRWTNFFKRTWVYFSNIFFLFGLVIPFVSQFSFRALFSISPYYPKLTVNQNTGKLEADRSYKVRTFVSRLVAIWHNVSESRTKFESIPDKGLIGKSMQRVFNIIWNYFFKGFVGSVGLTLIYPAMCVFTSILSLILCMTSPVWLPIICLLIHLMYLFIYDWDYPYTSLVFVRFFRVFQIILFRIIIIGIMQPILALGTAIIVCPVLSLAITLFAVIRKSLRKIWDNIMFYTILKPHARIPSRDTFVARRCAGPGLASNFFYQISIEQALALLESDIEIKILDSYIAYIETKLKEPLNLYKTFFDQLFVPYSYSLDYNLTKNNYQHLDHNVRVYLAKYRRESERRRLLLLKKRSKANIDLSKIRLTEKDLKIFLTEATKIVKKNYESFILKYKKMSPTELFQENMLEKDDWLGFTGSVLESIFSIGILTPLEKTDLYFSIKVDHLNLSKYSEMIANSQIRDDLDAYFINYNPKKNHIRFDKPQLDKGLFNPNAGYLVSEISEIVDKAKIDLKPPENLAITAVVVHNGLKENENKKIDFDSFNSVTKIFKAKNGKF